MSARPLEAKLLQAQHLKVDCILILKDDTEIPCSRIVDTRSNEGEKIVVVERGDGTEVSFPVSDIQTVRFG